MRPLVDESFVPANQQTRVLYCRLSNFIWNSCARIWWCNWPFLRWQFDQKCKTSFGSKTVKLHALLVYGNIKNQFRNVAYTNSISRIWQAKRALAGAWGKASFMCTLNNNSSIIRYSHFRALLYFESIVETSRRLRPRRF